MRICFDKKYTTAIIFFLFFSTVLKIVQSKDYSPFNLSSNDIQTIFNQTIVVPACNNLPADISFICADIKYNNGRLKFCELGDALYMSFTRDMRLEINGTVKTMHAPGWGIFWHYLKQFGLPVWFVGTLRNSNAQALDVLSELGQHHQPTLHDLEKKSLFQNALKKDFVKTDNINDYRGIIVHSAFNGTRQEHKEIKAFKKRYPEFIFINNKTHRIASHKELTYNLFYEADLSQYLPHFKIYPKVYQPEIVKDILEQFTSKYLVIKPLAGSCSRGVSIIKRGELDTLLSLILTKDKRTLQQSNIPWVSEWNNDTDSNFIVSEFVDSKTLFMNKKPYDPTMRIMCILRHDQRNLYITVIGAFWKIPITSLSDKATLTDKHVTRAHLNIADPDAFHSGILVGKDDMQNVRQILNRCLPVLYEKILTTQQNTDLNN